MGETAPMGRSSSYIWATQPICEVYLVRPLGEAPESSLFTTVAQYRQPRKGVPLVTTLGDQDKTIAM